MYGNLHAPSKQITPEQFADIAKKLPELRLSVPEIAKLAKEQPERAMKFFGECLSWSAIYELTFVDQIGFLIVLLDMQEPIMQAHLSADPHQAILDITEDGAELDQWYELKKHDIDRRYFLWLLMILQRNALSIMLHHQSLGGLVDEVRKGNDEAFFKAVMIDRSILSCPTFANRLAKAEFLNDKNFFLHLRKAIKGPSLKHMATIGDVRYGIALLRESGFETFTDDQLVQFFVATRLYPNTYNATKNLRKHIQAAKKFART